MGYDPNSEWSHLDRATRAVVQQVIDESKQSGQRTGRAWQDGEIYAYPHPGGGTAWGVDGRVGNLKRGIQR